MLTTDQGSRAERFALIERLPRSELREEWRRLYGSSPPNFSRDLFVRALTYRVQELAEGVLSRLAQRKLGAETEVGKESGAIELNLRPGARLVREWRGLDRAAPQLRVRSSVAKARWLQLATSWHHQPSINRWPRR